MNCSECKFSAQREHKTDEYICHNPDCPYFIQRLNLSFCEYGVSTISGASQTHLFSEPQIELYSVVYKIDTGVTYTHNEYLVNATSKERAIELVKEYFKNTAQCNESIVEEPAVHVLRKEGVISSSLGSYSSRR